MAVATSLNSIVWRSASIDHRCDAESDPDGQEDWANDPSRAIWNLFTKEHEKTGIHIAALDDELWSCEELTWAGDDADGKTINLSDGTLNIKFIRVWSEAFTYSWFRSEDMAGDNSATTNSATGFTANYIESVGTGSFTVGTAINTSGNDYYCVVYGI